MWAKSFRVSVRSPGRTQAEGGSHALVCARVFSPLL